MAFDSRKKQKRAQAQAENAVRRKRRRHGKRTLHYFVLLFFLLAVGAILSFTVLFRIEDIVVLGADRYTPADIATASGVQLEDNLLRINKDRIRENILEQFPYVKAVEVRRLPLPPTVEITVTPSEPAGALLQEEEVVLIDDEGKVLERGLLMIPKGVLLVRGIDAQGAQPGDFLGAYTAPALKAGEEPSEEEKEKELAAKATVDRLVALGYLRKAIAESGFKGITNVDITDRLNMWVMYEDRVAFKLGTESQLPYKLEMIQVALDGIEPDAQGSIDATRVTHNEVVYDPIVSRGMDKIINGEANEEQPEPEQQEEAKPMQILFPDDVSAAADKEASSEVQTDAEEDGAAQTETP